MWSLHGMLNSVQCMHMCMYYVFITIRKINFIPSIRNIIRLKQKHQKNQYQLQYLKYIIILSSKTIIRFKFNVITFLCISIITPVLTSFLFQKSRLYSLLIGGLLTTDSYKYFFRPLVSVCYDFMCQTVFSHKSLGLYNSIGMEH